MGLLLHVRLFLHLIMSAWFRVACGAPRCAASQHALRVSIQAKKVGWEAKRLLREEKYQRRQEEKDNRLRRQQQKERKKNQRKELDAVNTCLLPVAYFSSTRAHTQQSHSGKACSPFANTLES
jgi:Asp-tRNA(Asn)/Glu-tRNA(Gln) amidotransferase A subunit family amidase